MIKLGNINTLEVVKEKEFGLYLNSDVGEILLPKKYVPKDIKIGDTIDVFVYKDSEDRYIATTKMPYGVVGDFVCLEVKDCNKIGAFLDWGLEKDLLVPYSEQPKKLKVGKKYVVRICEDKVSKRIVASAKLNKYISNEEGIDVKEGEEVDLLICEILENGFKAIINNKYYGLLYKTQTYQDLKKGDKLKGFVKKIREDNKIDLSLAKRIDKEIEEAKQLILKELNENGGHLNLGDKSSPDDIKNKLKMSKNTFKRAIGGLYKEKIISLNSDFISLKK